MNRNILWERKTPILNIVNIVEKRAVSQYEQCFYNYAMISLITCFIRVKTQTASEVQAVTFH